MGVKFTLGLSLALVITLTIVTAIDITYQDRVLMNREKESANKLADSILTAIRHPMMTGDQDIIQLQFDKFKDFEDIEVLHLLDHNGVIRRSTNRSLIGEKSKEKGLEEVLKGKEYIGIELRERTKTRVYSDLRPILNEQSCYSCHGAEQKVLGVLRLAMDWSLLDKALIVSRTRHILISLISLVLINLLIFIFLFWMIIRPIQKLRLGTEIIGAGNLNYKVGINAEDEIGQLARAFDKMTENLKRTTLELERSNKELEQFAHVASHDLQEPLRIVTSYIQLLEKRYKGKLDKDAEDFISYAMDGATHMQQFIKDLLALSRVGSSGRPFKLTDCESVLKQSLSNLEVAIEESGTKITHEPLPEVMADNLQLVQLFQNLISNAIKFRGKEPPLIHISVRKERNEWVFSVQDNGIGIDKPHHGRIFEIFHRLHTREEYPGTGFGLAICKKIVQRHNGRIWVKSELGKGATFYFTLPAP